MRLEKNNSQSFGAVRISYSPSKENFLKTLRIKAIKGLTYDNLVVIYAFPQKSSVNSIVSVLKGRIVSDDLAKAHIRNKRLDTIFGAIPRLIDKIFHSKK